MLLAGEREAGECRLRELGERPGRHQGVAGRLPDHDHRTHALASFFWKGWTPTRTGAPLKYTGSDAPSGCLLAVVQLAKFLRRFK